MISRARSCEQLVRSLPKDFIVNLKFFFVWKFLSNTTRNNDEPDNFMVKAKSSKRIKECRQNKKSVSYRLH